MFLNTGRVFLNTLPVFLNTLPVFKNTGTVCCLNINMTERGLEPSGISVYFLNLSHFVQRYKTTVPQTLQCPSITTGLHHLQRTAETNRECETKAAAQF